MEITHFSHKHSLVLSSDHMNGVCTCSGCRLPITGPAYVCANCKYFIHKSCAELPLRIDHPFHPRHPLSLVKASYPSPEFCCKACQDICSGFFFRCSQTQSVCRFNLDIVCASLRPENHGKEIDHFSHHHPLTPVTCYEYEDKHKIKCSLCDEPIKGLIYVCFECPFFVHKSCSELPRQIQHPFHPTHDLTLLAKEPNHGFSCHVCDLKSSGFAYHCSECGFNLDILCSMLKKPVHTDEGNQEQLIIKPSHEHPLTSVPCVEDAYNVACSVCSMFVQKTDGSIYVCFDCKFFIHESCAELPSEIEAHPFHPQHSLLLIRQEVIKSHTCRVCSELCQGLVYYCSICDFALDIACTMLLPTIGREHIERQIQHYSHPHCLIPFDVKNHVLICCGCDSMLGDSSYACPQCLFFLCRSCVEMPEIIKHTIFHPQHKLTFLPNSPDGVPVFCNACCDMHFGLVYHCATCKFYIGLRCAPLPTVKYEGHEHPLAFVNQDSDFKCHICSTFCRRSFLRCVLCDLNFHVKCIPALPPTVKVKTHRHRLTLTDPLPETDDSDEFICDACEKDRNPKFPAYQCAKCELVAHIACGLSEMVISTEEESSAEEESMVLRQLLDAGFDPYHYYSSEEKSETKEDVMYYTSILKQALGIRGNFDAYWDARKQE